VLAVSQLPEYSDQQCINAICASVSNNPPCRINALAEHLRLRRRGDPVRETDG
jgi:hypothetical protein